MRIKKGFLADDNSFTNQLFTHLETVTGNCADITY